MKTHAADVTYLRLYPRDLIPVRELFSRRALVAIQEQFGFASFTEHLSGEDEDDGPPGWLFESGRPSTSQNTWPLALTPLSVFFHTARIEIAVHVDGRTKVAEATAPDTLVARLLTEFAALCDDILPQGGDWVNQPTLERIESVWVGRLEIDSNHIIDPRLKRLLPKIQELAGQDSRFKTTMLLRDLSFAIIHHILDENLLISQVNLADEEFRLEPRETFPSEDRVWYSSAPFRASLHHDLLKQIEAAFQVD